MLDTKSFAPTTTYGMGDIGSLSFNWEGVQFAITGAKKIDEFDKAAQTVKERYGKEATLVRVPLKDEKPRS